jgi:hypothetical protein
MSRSDVARNMANVGPADPVRAGAPSWDIAVPSRPGRLAGVTMAGFSDRENDLVDVGLVPHPAVMVVFEVLVPLRSSAGRW